MKIVRTVIVFDRGDLARSEGWATTYSLYSGVIDGMVNPKGADRFRIRAKTPKLDDQGKRTTQWNRNGVPTVKAMFLDGMKKQEWKIEQPVSLNEYLRAYSKKHPLLVYPGLNPLADKLHTSVGDFDFTFETRTGFHTAVEWETGNVSSSHRSLNKMCLVLVAGLVDATVLIVPSRTLYKHLTDRIGNWEELCPYLPALQALGSKMVKRGLLAITVVEHDEVVTDESIPYIPVGPDGRSAEGHTKLR